MASGFVGLTLCGIAMSATACKAVTPYPLKGENWGVEFNSFLCLRGKEGECKPREIEEQAADDASVASDGERPGTTIARFALLTRRALLVELLLFLAC